MTEKPSEFTAFNNFTIDKLDPRAEISRRMLKRLENVDNVATGGPRTPEGRAALASSVVAHAVVELETLILDLTNKLESKS